MITIVTGKPGAGKTLFLTYKALEKVSKGFDVYANWKLDFTLFVEKKKLSPEKFGHVYFWSEIPELLHIKGGQIFIDEAQGYFDSREWQDMPPSAKQKFSAHRHDVRTDDNGNVIPLDIWAGVQHTSNIDKRIRDLGHNFLEVKNLVRTLFMVSTFELHDLKDDAVRRRAVKRSFFFFSKLKADCYNTHEAIKFIEYPEFPYHRDYAHKLSNDNTGLIPNDSSIPPFSKQQRKKGSGSP